MAPSDQLVPACSCGPLRLHDSRSAAVYAVRIGLAAVAAFIQRMLLLVCTHLQLQSVVVGLSQPQLSLHQPLHGLPAAQVGQALLCHLQPLPQTILSPRCRQQIWLSHNNFWFLGEGLPGALLPTR